MHHVLDLAEAVVVVGWDKNCHPTEQDIAKEGSHRNRKTEMYQIYLSVLYVKKHIHKLHSIIL
jgi:hypothetical protein